MLVTTLACQQQQQQQDKYKLHELLAFDIVIVRIVQIQNSFRYCTMCCHLLRYRSLRAFVFIVATEQQLHKQQQQQQQQQQRH